MGKAIDYTQDFLKNMDKAFPGAAIYRLNQYTKEFVKEGVTPKAKGAFYVGENRPKWNDEKNMSSIFFSPNGNFGAREDKVRRETLATHITCFFMERDDDVEFKIEFWHKLPHPPSVINETMRGYHCYWLLETPVDYESHKKDWLAIQRKICEQIGGDASIIEVARIMRLPGSNYWKNENNGAVTKCIHFDLNTRYKFSDFSSYLEDEKKAKEYNTYKPEYKHGSSSSKYTWQTIQSQVDVREALHDLSGGKYVVKGTRIYENGELTGGYRYVPSGNYLRNFTEEDHYRIEGGPFQIARNHFGNIAKTYMYFYDKYGIGEKDKFTIKENKEGLVKKNETQKVEDDFDIEIASNDATIKIDSKACRIYKITGKGEKEIGIGYLRPMGYYKVPDGSNAYIVRYKRDGGEEGSITMKDVSSINEFCKILAKYGITFLGTKYDFLAILQYIHASRNEYEYINTLGLLDKDLMINKSGKYILEGKYYVECTGLESSNRKTNEIIKIGESMSKTEFLGIIKSLSGIYEGHIVHSMFCMYGIALFSKYIRDTLSWLPLMILVGLTQSGKTTLRRFMMDMFGIDKSSETQASATEFSIMHMMNNYLPIHIAEFDNNVLKFDFDSFAKNNYDNTSSTRGRADQTIVKYPFNAAIVVDGETRTLAPSVYSRSIMMFMNPSYYDKSKEVPVPTIINKYFIDNYDKIKGITEYASKWNKFLSGLTKDMQSSEKGRILENYSLLLGFADCFGFLDIVKESIIKQMYIQFQMKGEDNLNVYIKNVLNMATINVMPVSFVKENIVIDFFIDVLRYDSRKIADIQSNIQTVNHHFDVGGNGTDQVIVPLKHIFETKALHATFNRYLNKMEAFTHLNFQYAGDAIIQYCDANGYKEAAFYERLHYK